MKNSNSTKYLTTAGLFTALILVATYFHTPMPNANGGFIHVGDAVIYLCASLLPLGYSICAASIGGALCDIISGYSIYALPTLIIKALLCIAFTSKKNTLLSKRNCFASIIGLPVTVIGYYIAESILYGSFITPVASILGNVVQAVGSIVIYLVVASALDKADFKNSLKY